MFNLRNLILEFVAITALSVFVWELQKELSTIRKLQTSADVLAPRQPSLVYILVLRLLPLDVITISECIGRFPLLFRLMKYLSLMAPSEAVCELVRVDKYACPA